MGKGTWTIIIIAIIVIGIIFGISMDKEDRPNLETTNRNVQEEMENKEHTNTENQEVTQNIIEDETVNEINSEVFEEEPETEEEKAALIVKKDYGTNSNIKFSVEGMDANGRHVVVVRDINTTEALAFYFVNVSDGTFTKKEMN